MSGHDWKEIAERHGFGALIALLLMGTMFGWFPSVVTRHIDHDTYRDYVLWQICEHLHQAASVQGTHAMPCLQPPDPSIARSK